MDRSHDPAPGGPAAGAAQVRPLVPADAGTVWTLLREFAEFEKLSDRVSDDPARLASHLAGESWPRVEGFLAARGGTPVGYALYYGLFASFPASPLLWLEDLYVRESARGLGVGRALLAAVARVAVERGCERLAWAVLDWNQGAIDFYRALGARRQEGWHTFELEAEPLRALTGPGGGPTSSIT